MFGSNSKKSIRDNAYDQSRWLSVATGSTVSKQTMNRRLGHIGLYAPRLLRCVLLTATHCSKWLAWIREHAMCICRHRHSGHV
ncbi:hypothetical protein TNCV_728351 [Trichonephila clavipes]|nr:hypothetical protein TNCV_728351 [Trichonephila clavipes]